jgi:hypothetical protein
MNFIEVKTREPRHLLVTGWWQLPFLFGAKIITFDAKHVIL